MSTNVDYVEYIGDGRLSIRRGTAVGLQIVYERDIPEGCWLREIDTAGDQDEMLLIDPFWWDGTRSGTAYDTLVHYLLPETTGFAQLMFVWECGEWFTGLEVNNGAVTEKPVRFTLE